MTFYHGTRVPFGPGGLVLPGDMFGIDNHELNRSDWVYVTADLELAKEYARCSKYKRARPKVFEVTPAGTIGIDDSTVGDEEQDSYRCEAAHIVRRVWIESKS